MSALSRFVSSALIGLSLSFTRIHAMHKFNTRPDPMDYTCIQVSNCLQCISCVFDILAIFDKSFKDLAHCVDCVADCAFHITAGCMIAQTNAELNYRAMHNAGMAQPLVAAPAAAPATGGKGGLNDGLLGNAAVVDMER